MPDGPGSDGKSSFSVGGGEIPCCTTFRIEFGLDHSDCIKVRSCSSSVK